MKGYRVKVNYDTYSEKQVKKKENLFGRFSFESNKKMKKIGASLYKTFHVFWF